MDTQKKNDKKTWLPSDYALSPHTFVVVLAYMVSDTIRQWLSERSAAQDTPWNIPWMRKRGFWLDDNFDSFEKKNRLKYFFSLALFCRTD